MKSAYYSRANSYSKSYNAHVAEREGRYPRTIAAKRLGLSVKAFDAGCEKIGYTPSEWHHVGKFATRVDYYDAAELGNNPLFWKGATTRSNASFCSLQITKLMRSRMTEKFQTKKQVQADYIPSYIGCGEYRIPADLSDHNQSKIVREIARKRLAEAANKNNWESAHIPGRMQRFTLYTNGAIFDNKGRSLSYNSINWGAYLATEITPGGAVRFVHNNYL